MPLWLHYRDGTYEDTSSTPLKPVENIKAKWGFRIAFSLLTLSLIGLTITLGIGMNAPCPADDSTSFYFFVGFITSIVTAFIGILFVIYASSIPNNSLEDTSNVPNNLPPSRSVRARPILLAFGALALIQTLIDIFNGDVSYIIEFGLLSIVTFALAMLLE